MNNRKEYIICAAIWYPSEKEHLHQPKNITNGYVICGRRHHNCIRTKEILGGLGKQKCVQGFLSSEDRFLTRKEAMVVALESGQVDYDLPNKIESDLISEELY